MIPRVEVRVYATLRAIVGGRSVALPGACATVDDAIGALVERFPDLRSHLFTESGDLRPFIAVMVSGRDIRHLDGRQTVLQPGDELDIFPAVAGGR
jgi:MoaD family protein